MKIRRLLFSALFVLIAGAVFAAEEDDTLYYSVDAAVMVFDRVKSSTQLTDWAEKNGGYFTWKSDESVRLRVPDEAVPGFKSFLEGMSEALIRFDQSTADLREELTRSRSALEAREEVLAKNLEYLSTSDVEGTLELEQEIRRLMSEIDSYRGLLRRLEHDRAMALIQVALSFQQSTVPTGRPSNFAWINSVDFYSFMNVPLRKSVGLSFGRRSIVLPENFALVDRSPDFLAVSPEGVRLRMTDTENYPEQSADFWFESLSNELEERGYRHVDIDVIPEWGGESPFVYGLWAVPWGNEDYLFLTGLRLRGSKIEILEMAGPVQYVSEYIGL